MQMIKYVVSPARKGSLRRGRHTNCLNAGSCKRYLDRMPITVYNIEELFHPARV